MAWTRSDVWGEKVSKTLYQGYLMFDIMSRQVSAVPDLCCIMTWRLAELVDGVSDPVVSSAIAIFEQKWCVKWLLTAAVYTKQLWSCRKSVLNAAVSQRDDQIKCTIIAYHSISRKLLSLEATGCNLKKNINILNNFPLSAWSWLEVDCCYHTMTLLSWTFQEEQCKGAPSHISMAYL